MTHYVLGFAFNARGERVVLIQKKRPRWQEGRWNGVGGHVESRELPLAAMSGEFYEETGVITNESTWTLFATLEGPDYKMWVFKAFTDLVYHAHTNTDEVVGMFFADNLPDVISNLHWLVPMANRDRPSALYTIHEVP